MNGDNIVVTYMISAQETIDLERLPTKPAPRLSVWKKGATGWQWIRHANLTPFLRPDKAVRLSDSQFLPRDQFLKSRIIADRVPFPAIFQIVDGDAVIGAVHRSRDF